MAILGDTEVGSLVETKRPIISIPETASVQTALRLMQSNNIVALPVSAPPGKWLGAGGSLIIDRDKQYIGMVSMIDVAITLASLRCAGDTLRQPVVDLIGSSPEGLSIWVYEPNTRLTAVLEPLSKGVHRVLIRNRASPSVSAAGPVPGSPESAQGPSLPSASPSEYLFLSQTDVVAFLLRHMAELGPVVRRTLFELSLVDPLFPPLAVSEGDTVLNALRLMRKAAGVRAVAVVQEEGEEEEEEGGEGREEKAEEAQAGQVPSRRPAQEELDLAGPSAMERMREEDARPATWRKGGVLSGTLSVTDFRGLDSEILGMLGAMKVRQFLRQTQNGGQGPRAPVACRPDATLEEAMSLAVANRVHRVWVTTEEGDLVGVVSLSDMIASLRRGTESYSQGV